MIPKHDNLSNRLPSQLALMLHQQIHAAGPTGRAQQRQKRLCAHPEPLDLDMLPCSAVDGAVDDEIREEVVDAVMGDVAEVFDVGFGVGGDGFPHGEGDVGPEDGFAGGFVDV